MKKLFATILLLSVLLTVLGGLSVTAAVTTNLFTNGTLLDDDSTSTPDGWDISETSPGMVSFLKYGDAGYSGPEGYEGNYVILTRVDSGVCGLSQIVRGLEENGVYRVSVMYKSTSVSAVWDMTPYYYSSSEDKTGKTLSSFIDTYNTEHPTNPIVTTGTITNWATSNSSFTTAPFNPSETWQYTEYVFRMPSFNDGRADLQGSELGLKIYPRTAGQCTLSLADLVLEPTDNFVLNGSFEHGNRSWVHVPNNYDSTEWNTENAYTNIINDGTSSEGSNYLSIKYGTKANALWQKIPAISNTTYRLSFDCKSEVSTHKPTVYVDNGSNVYVNYKVGANVTPWRIDVGDQWKRYTYYFTTTPTETSFNVRLTAYYLANGQHSCFDNVKISIAHKSEALFYNADTGAELLSMPGSGTKVMSRGIVKTTSATKDALLINCLYKNVNGVKQMVKVTMGGGAALPMSTQNASTATNYIEVNTTLVLPSGNEWDETATYSMKTFMVDTITNMSTILESRELLTK